MKSIETKVSNILNPAKKGGEHKVNRKVLATDDSGSCGTGVTYTFTASTGELKISGTGAMTDYKYNTMPWDSYRDSIKSVTIGSGVTSIGDYAFYGCSGLTSVTIPNSVTSIGSNAFYGCSGLTGTLTIPDSVTSIGYAAFRDCSGLTSINVDENNTRYKSIDGVLYSKDKTTLIQCPGGKTGEITIPDSVTSIGDFAFSGCSGLTSVTYTGVTEPSFGEKVFDNCPQLTEVSVPYNYKGSSFCGLSINRMPETTPEQTTETTDDSIPSELTSTDDSTKGNSNTALIASTVSVAAAAVIAAITAITCYFKNPSSFPCLRTSGNDGSSDDAKV